MARLIDYDDFLETFCELDKEPYNNFPTIEITEEQAIEKLHETGWMQRHDKEMTERPTGEWLEWEDERWGGVWHYCSNCHNDALYKRVDGTFKQILSDFCPYCGVKMKGEEE